MYSQINKPYFGTATTTAPFGFGTTSTSSQRPFSQPFSMVERTSEFGSPSHQQPFGAPSRKPGFLNMFDQQNSCKASPFGQQNKTTGFNFGTVTNPLCAQQSSASFGQQQPSPFGCFGSTPSQLGTAIQYEPTPGIDTIQKSGITSSICTKLYCITCMKVYENKSMEELRWGDYQENRKGSQQQPAITTSLQFGQNQSKPAFGIGLANPSHLGMLYKSPTPFGATSAATSMTTIKPFNAQSATNFFGATTAITTSSNQPFRFAPTFGQAGKQHLEGLFSKFTQPTPSAQPLGHQSANLSSTLDASKFKAGFSSFVPKTPSLNTSFVQPMINQLPTQTTVGQPLQTTAGQPFELKFGTATPSLINNSLFSATTQNSCTPSCNAFLVQPQQQLMQQPHLNGAQEFESSLQEFHNNVQQIFQPFPRREFLKSPNNTTKHQLDNPGPYKEFVEKPAIQVAFTNFAKRSFPKSRGKHYALLDDVVDASPLSSFTKKNCGRCLILNNNKPKNDKDMSKLLSTNKLQLSENHFGTEDKSVIADDGGTMSSGSAQEEKNDSVHLPIFKWKKQSETVLPKGALFKVPEMSTIGTQTVKNVKELGPTNKKQLSFSDGHDSDSTEAQIPLELNIPPKDISADKSVEAMHHSAYGDGVVECSSLAEGDSELVAILPHNPYGVKLERPEYYTIPPLHELSKYANNCGDCIIKGLTIGRAGYGNIYFFDAIDVSNLDLDDIIDFQYREVTVYPDDSKKPPVGEGLNRRAQVTLDQIWPLDKDGEKRLKEPQEIAKVDFVARLVLLSTKQNATFLDYRPETGSWVFMVKHFSKFRFDDSEDEEVAQLMNEMEEENNGCESTQISNALLCSNGEDESIQLMKRKRGEKDKKCANLENNNGEEKKEVEKNLIEEHHDKRKITQTDFDEVEVINQGFLLRQDEEVAQACKIWKGATLPSSKITSNFAIMKYSLFSNTKLYGNTEVARSSPQLPSIKVRRRTKDNILKRIPLFNRNYITPMLTLQNSRNYADVGLFKGKSFKVGWGHGFKFTRVSCRGKFNLLCLEINQSNMLNVEEHMQISFHTSAIVMDDSEVPLCIVKDGWEALLRYQNSNNGADTKVWDLCLALWGPHADTPSTRRELFSRWLEDEACSYVETELKPHLLSNLFTYLSGHQVNKAAHLAIELGLPQLATLISQSGAQELMYNQVAHWKESGVINFIDQDILKLYMVLSGIPVISDVNLCKDLDWKRVLALHLWYMCPNGTSITHAIKAYQKSFEVLNYALPPNPEHHRCSDLVVYDLLFYIILLHTQQSSPMDKILNPLAHTEEPLDYQLSWLLLQVFTSLKVGTVPPPVAISLHVNFASQLENKGLWKWAVFVLLFIKDASFKINAIIGILDRNINPDRTCKQSLALEDSLVNDLKIPRKWIHTILAQKTDFQQRHVETYGHLICSGDWFKAHNVAMTWLVPEWMASRQYGYLYELLEHLSWRKGNIASWNTGAGLVLDILSLQHKVNTNNRWLSKAHMRSKLMSLCSRMKSLSSKSPMQTWALAELSRFISIVLRTFYCNMEPRLLNDIQNLVTEIKMLPMPYDYKLEELRCVSQYLLD